MEATVHKDLTPTPLSTIAPRRIIAASNTAPPVTTEDQQNKQTEQALRQQEQLFLQALRARDREVRAHEAAHLAAGRPYVRSGPSYTYQQGPDGRSYAIGGEVQLDTSAVADDPEATLDKAEQIRRAALAPAQPSPQDTQVAANASQMAARARIEIAVARREQEQNAEQVANATGTPQASADRNSSSPLAAFNPAEEAPSTFSQFA